MKTRHRIAVAEEYGSMWLRTFVRMILIALVTIQLFPPAGTPQVPGVSGLSSTTTLWTVEEWTKAKRFRPLRPLPADSTNALADNPGAARLGHCLFFDLHLSSEDIICATCHRPQRGFTDGLAVANMLAPRQRNTMTILNVGYYRWLTDRQGYVRARWLPYRDFGWVEATKLMALIE